MEGKVKVLWREWVVCNDMGEVARFDSLKAALACYRQGYATYVDRVETLEGRDQYGDHITVRFCVRQENESR